MLGSFSNKAIAAKARAMYGHRVTEADYEELMKKRTVGDAAAYLRDNTHYREVLGQVDAAAIHRGQLENLLRSFRYFQYQRLIAYNFGQQKLYRYLYFREEIQQLLGLLRYLSGKGQGQASGQYDFHYDRRLVGHTSYDLEKLVEVGSYRELLDFFGDTPYGKILHRFPPDQSGQIDLMGCEQAFSTYYYKQLLTTIDRELTGDARAATREVIYRRIGYENLVQAYRLKRFFHSGEEYIRRSLLPFRTPSDKLIQQLIQAESTAQLHALLENAGLAPEGADHGGDFIENIILRLRAKQSKRDLRNSRHPEVVLQAYMAQLEIELDDIINIIESVRYGLPVEEMRGMLSSQ